MVSWTSLKLKISALWKTVSREGEDKPLREIFAKDIFDKGQSSKIYTEHFKFSNKKTDNLILKCTKDLNRHLTKEDIQMANRHMKRYFTSYAIKEMWIKPDTTTHLYKWPKSGTLTTPNVSKDVEQQELLLIISGNAKYSHCGRQSNGFL